MESCLAEIAARTAGSVMLSAGRSPSSKNISSRPPGTMRARSRPPSALAVITCRVPLLADGERELAVKDEEGLLHAAVDMRHRPDARTAGELGKGEGPAGS